MDSVYRCPVLFSLFAVFHAWAGIRMVSGVYNNIPD